MRFFASVRLRHRRPRRDGPPGDDSLVDITPGSDEYGEERGIAWKETRGNAQHVRLPALARHQPPFGSPLLADTTYAAIVTTGVKMDEHRR